MKDIEAQQFFLVYHGKGYTWADTKDMTLDELERHSQRLLDQLKKEADQNRQRNAAMKREADRAKRRYR